MPSNPTYEELLAQVATLQAQLLAQQPLPPLFVREVPGVAPPSQPDKKTSQAAQAVPTLALPSAQQLALARALDPLRRLAKATPEELVAQITALKAVIISGVNSAGYGDKRTEFRSLTELRQILNGLEEELGDLLGTGTRIRQIRMTTQWDKGL